MTNAEIIATTLDGLLDHEVRLIIYGRAALALGFDNVPESVGKSLDLDVILPFSEAARIEADDQFWAAQQQLNKSLEIAFHPTARFLQPGRGSVKGSNRAYPFIGVRDGHHSISHHGHDPVKLAKIQDINVFHTTQLAISWSASSP